MPVMTDTETAELMHQLRNRLNVLGLALRSAVKATPSGSQRIDENLHRMAIAHEESLAILAKLHDLRSSQASSTADDRGLTGSA